MKRYRLAAVFLAAAFLFSGCTQESDGAGSRNDGEESTDVSGTEESDDMADEVFDTSEQQMNGNEVITEGSLPDELAQIPGEYYSESEHPGTPDRPAEFKNVLDNAMADGKIRPMIVVCPTYNNESEDDSADYSLALQLTENYHNELVNDLIPAVERTYSTYAEDTTPEGLEASRDHRAFCGFSMGSVATWRTFQYCLDYFRYFMPSSGNLTSDGEYMASLVRDSGHEWDDFFIFAASGTEDFAYSSFKSQIEAMADVSDGTFRYADNERDGNLYFLEQEGGVHSGEYAQEYFYNGLCWIWQ